MTISLELQIVRKCAFGIVDAAMIEHLPHGLCIEPLVPKKLSQSAHLMPALIDLRRTPKESLNALLRKIEESYVLGESPSVSLFIKTDSGITELAQYWNAMQIVEPQRGRKLWLRLHDPRVLHQLLRILELTQRRKLFGLSQAFIYWVGTEWVTASCEPGFLSSSQIRGIRVGALYTGPANWDWNRIERISLVNRVLIATGVSDATALTSQGALAEKFIERAIMQHDLSESADLVEFATRGLQTNFSFDECPDIVQSIRSYIGSARDSTLADRFALIDKQVWGALPQPLNVSGEKVNDL
jgi:hypothetical protein